MQASVRELRNAEVSVANGERLEKKTISEEQMNLKKTLIGLVIAACLAGSLFAQNKTSKETKMGKSLVVYFSLAGEQYKSHRLRAA